MQTTLEMTWAGRKEWASKFSWLQTSCKVESQQTLKILSIILKAIFNLGKWKLFSVMRFSELNIATSHKARFHSFELFFFLNGHTTNDYKHTTEDRTQEWWNFVARKLLKSMCPMRKQITLLYFFCMLTNINLTKQTVQIRHYTAGNLLVDKIWIESFWWTMFWLEFVGGQFWMETFKWKSFSWKFWWKLHAFKK